MGMTQAEADSLEVMLKSMTGAMKTTAEQVKLLREEVFELRKLGVQNSLLLGRIKLAFTKGDE